MGTLKHATIACGRLAGRRGESELFLRRGRTARRKPGQALVPTAAGRLPIDLSGRDSQAEARTATGLSLRSRARRAGHRLKWLASTCLAGMVGVCLIGFAVYASMSISRRQAAW